jgi:phosphoglycerol geranylgeranyltransferase
MAHQEIFNQLTQLPKKRLAVLIDPDSVTDKNAIDKTIALCQAHHIDFILVGGSLITNGFWNECIQQIKSCTPIPVILFPGNNMQIHQDADAILFLSLISGRNADLLIGKQVLAAPEVKRAGIEVIPTGYMLIEGGSNSSVMYMSNTMPIPKNKNNIAATTAMAGEMLGLKTIYMDAGSGANWPVSQEMIQAVRSSVQLPLFVGGGIRTPEQAVAACKAGADVVVVGNAFEQNPELIQTIAEAVHALNN